MFFLEIQAIKVVVAVVFNKKKYKMVLFIDKSVRIRVSVVGQAVEKSGIKEEESIVARNQLRSLERIFQKY